jgi:predicted transcriptional regulator
MNVILSIHPKWAKLIYEGKKTIEWRKIIPSCLLPIYSKHKPLKVYLYETSPIKKVSGYFVCRDVVRLDMTKPPFEGATISPEADDVIKKGCVTLNDLEKYAGEKHIVFGLKVMYCSKFFKGPKPLEDFGLERPPQSWCYTEVDV